MNSRPLNFQFYRRLRFFQTLICGLSFGLLTTAVGWAEAPAETGENIWLSSVRWIDAQNLVATQSQGLLLRPGSVVRIAADQPSVLVSSGQAETSLWSVLPMGDETLASDYRGAVLRLGNQSVGKFEVDARWIRKLVQVPASSSEVLAGTEDGKLILLSTETNREVRRAELAPVAIFDIAFSPDLAQVAVSSGDGSIQILTWPSLEATKTIKGSGAATWAVLYSAEGNRLLTGGADRKVQLWDAQSGIPIVSVATTSDWITDLVALPNSTLVAASSLNGDVTLVDYSTLLSVLTLRAAKSGIWSMDLSLDGQRLALATRRDGLVLLDIADWYEQGRAAAAKASSEQPPEPVR